MSPERTPEGKWVLFHRATGQRLERWSVDARAMMGSGDYTADPSECQVAAATVIPAPASPPLAPLPTEYAPGVPLVAQSSATAEPAKVQPAKRTRAR